MQRHRWTLGLSVLLAALLVAASAYLLVPGRSQSVAPTALRPDDPQTVAAGASLYARHCAACHGEHGEGQQNWREHGPDGRLPAPPHDASGHTWHHPDAQLFAIVKHGLPQLIRQPDYQTNMPIYDGMLSDADIVAVLSWIKAQWPQEVRARHDDVNRQYRKSLEP
jgi:mono/diheme cytochrome c family protein